MLSIIVAIAENNIIGGDNKLLWHIPEDLKRFKSITSGNTIIMGRKTFESLPGVLPNRKHVIITRDKNYYVDNENVEVIHSLSEVINKYKNSSEAAFIIGGGEIYKQLIHSVDNLLLTKVFKSFDGDTSFPQIDFNEFAVDFESEILTCEKNGLQYQFIDLVRK
ncbi:dihydrofolate reductase [Clostridium sp. D53t1_180928_C8]|uniref:dihydrofolate reductase n=1 Tax=Clostridium sp. D53t1_180928_C8 TaxID=2787101 RepID=UPI0018AB9C55|nr:dihydrofolate reductase [Clostridium sp. D53t1_180928_C8]